MATGARPQFCVYCFKPVFLDVLLERLQEITGSIVSDIRRVKEEGGQ